MVGIEQTQPFKGGARRQIEAVELMIAANTITAAHADALLKATLPEQRTGY